MKRCVVVFIALVMLVTGTLSNIRVSAMESDNKTMLHIKHLSSTAPKFGIKVDKTDITPGAYSLEFEFNFANGILVFNNKSTENLNATDSALLVIYSKQQAGNTPAQAQMQYGIAPGISGYYDNVKTIDNHHVKYEFTITQSLLNSTIDELYVGFFIKGSPEFFIANMTLYKSSDANKLNILPENPDATMWKYVNYMTPTNGSLPNGSGYLPYNESMFIPQKTMLHYDCDTPCNSGLKLPAGTFKANEEYVLSFNYKLGNNTVVLPDAIIFGNNGTSKFSKIINLVKDGNPSFALDENTATYTFTISENYVGCSDFHIGFSEKAEFYITNIIMYEAADYDKTNLLPLDDYTFNASVWESEESAVSYSYEELIPSYFKSYKTVFRYEFPNLGRSGLKLSKGTLKPNTEYTVSFNYYLKEGQKGKFALYDSSWGYLFLEDGYAKNPPFKSQMVTSTNATFTFKITSEQFNASSYFFIGFMTMSYMKLYLSDFVLYETADSSKTNRLPKTDCSTSRAGWTSRYYGADLGKSEYTKYGSGDSNADEIIDIRDLIIIKKHIVNKNFNPFADVKSDGILNAEDIVGIANQLLLSSESFPNDSDWISVHGANLENPPVGYAEKESEIMKNGILSASNTESNYSITGTKYYFSSDGDDSNDGLSPQSPLKTLEQINDMTFSEGDAILLERNSVFRILKTISFKDFDNIIIGSYGNGEKPRIYASPKDYSVEAYWNTTEIPNVWKAKYIRGEACGMFFDHGKFIGNLCRSGVDAFSKNGDFCYDKTGETVFLYYDKGNPSKYYKSIEIIPANLNVFKFLNVKDVTLDNVCIKYTGGFPFIGSGENINVTNCEMGYAGGLWNGQVRFGNGIEFSNMAKNICVENNWIYQIFDTAITWQCSKENSLYQNISFSNNLLEYNNADIEFYTRGASVVDNFRMENNIMRFTSMGWGTNAGIREIEGCISAHTYMLDSVGNISYKNNIMDCPARWVINWRDKPGRNLDIDTAGNKLYIKKSYRTTNVVLRGFARQNESTNIELTATNLSEATAALLRFDDSMKIEWYN